MLNVADMKKETVADAVLAFFRKWDEEKDGLYKIWDEIDQYRLATDSNQTLNAKGGFNHSTHLPDTLVIGNTLEALFEATIFPSARWFEWKPYEEGAASLDVRRAITAYTEHNHEIKETKEEGHGKDLKHSFLILVSCSHLQRAVDLAQRRFGVRHRLGNSFVSFRRSAVLRGLPGFIQ